MSSSRTLLTEDPRLLMHAYLDDELDDADALALKHKIDADPALGKELENYRAIQQALRAQFPSERLPPNLRARINAATGTGRKRVGPTWTAMAASLLLAVAVSSASTWVVLRLGQSESGAPGKVVGEEIAFPRELGIHYATAEGDASNLVRELYASPAALEAVRSGLPLPYGTVLIRNVFDVERDAGGVPLKDINGKPVRSHLLFTAVMEKRAGSAGEFPAGEWKYQSFAPDGTAITKPSAECFACHDKKRDQDFVFSLDRMKLAKR